MCFSATASFTAGTTLSVLGVATLTQVRSRKEVLLGIFPLLFATQQFIEGWVWLSLSQPSLSSLNSILTYGFLFFATGVWPILCPLSVYLLESKLLNRRILLGIIAAGILLGVYLFGSVVTHGVSPESFSGNLLYSLNFIPFYELSKYLYLLITSLPFLMANDKWLKLFGIVVILSFGISEIFYKVTFVSVWCFFAAVLSAGLYLIFRDSKRRVLNVTEN